MKRYLAILVSALMVIMTALPVMASTPFADVPDYHWASDAVNLLAALGIVEGYPDGTFLGKNQATRYEVAIMIARALEYLDRDIRGLAETVGELDAKVAGLQAPTAVPDKKDEVVLQPVASPDATILEQVIAEKIAGMSEAQWEQFDARLSALLARVDDLTEANKAEHTQLWAAIEALRASCKEAASCTVTPVAADVQQSAAMLPGCEKLIADAVAKSDAAWQAAVAKLEGKIAALAAEHDNFDARIEALRRALYDEARIAEEQNEAISLELSKKLQALSAPTTVVAPATPKDPEIVVVTVPAPKDEVDYEAAIKTLLAVHAAEERAARDAAMAELESKIELALLQQKAEVMMAFYDSIIASNVDRDILLAKLRADLEKAIADREAAIHAAVDARHEAMLNQAIDDSGMAITMAARESLNAYRDEVDRQFGAYAAEIEGKMAVSSAETDARFGNLYNQMANSNLVVDGKISDIDLRLANSTNELNAKYNELQARFDQALARQKAELLAAISGAADESNQKLTAALRAQKAEILDMHTASVNEMKAAYDARLNDMEASWEIALLQQKAELMMSFYDSISAERDAREKALQAYAEKHDLDLAQLRAELQMSFYDSIAAESDARQRAIAALAEQHDLDLLQMKAEMQMGYYDSMIALREDLETRIGVVIASVAALKDEYQKELTALSARVTNLESQLALVQARADQNARDIAAIRTDEIAPLNQRVRKLERESEIAKADIETNKTSIGNIWTELNRVKLSGSNEVKFVDVHGMADINCEPSAVLNKNPFDKNSPVYVPSSTMQNELKLTLTIQPDPGVKVIANIGMLTDVFGVADRDTMLPELDLDMSIVTPSGATSILAGELARPANLTKYQASAKVWGLEDIEGIAVVHDGNKIDLSGFVAKVGHDGADSTATEYMHIAGAGARMQLTEAISVGVRGMLKTHDELSGDAAAVGDEPIETLLGADVALKLGAKWTARGELSAFDSKDLRSDPAQFVYARDLSIAGKLGVLNIAAAHVQVDEGYEPSYRGTGSDVDAVTPDTRLSKLTLVTDSIGGFVINGLAQRKGDAEFDMKDVGTLGAGVKYSAELLGIGLTLRGDATYNNDAFAYDWTHQGIANLGFDLKYKPVSAGFTWKNYFEDSWTPAMSYIGYAKLDMPVGGDALRLRGGWEQSFGAEQWHQWGAGLKMAMPLIENRLTLNADAGYDVTHRVPTASDEMNDLARLVLAGGLTFNLTPETTLSGTASYESRDYEAPTTDESRYPSGEYLQFGAALNHKFYKNTSLTLKYDIKNVLYAAEPTGPADYGIRVVDLSLKTTF